MIKFGAETAKKSRIESEKEYLWYKLQKQLK